MAQKLLKVKFNKDMAGADSSFMQGERCFLPEDLARKFASVGTVDLLSDEPESDDDVASDDDGVGDEFAAGIETATRKPRETMATRRPPRAR